MYGGLHPSARKWLLAVDHADSALYRAVAATRATPLDVTLRRISRAADHSKLWIAAACLDATTQGAHGRRAAVAGLGSIAISSTIVNGIMKPLARRPRPDRTGGGVPLARHVPMPATGSLPSGHAASAFAFAAGAGRHRPRATVALHAMAAVVAYSRVHVGVHFPGDVVFGAVIGAVVARLAARAAPVRPSWAAAPGSSRPPATVAGRPPFGAPREAVAGLRARP